MSGNFSASFGRLSLNSLSVCVRLQFEEPNLHVNPTSEMLQTCYDVMWF